MRNSSSSKVTKAMVFCLTSLGVGRRLGALGLAEETGEAPDDSGVAAATWTVMMLEVVVAAVADAEAGASSAHEADLRRNMSTRLNCNKKRTIEEKANSTKAKLLDHIDARQSVVNARVDQDLDDVIGGDGSAVFKVWVVVVVGVVATV